MESAKFADPYSVPTGPTAHLPPVYPFLLSLIYRAFGLTPLAGYVSMMAIAITASALFALLPWVSGQLGLTWQAGFIAGVGAALSHEQWHNHGEYLAGIALALILVAFLHRWTQPSLPWWASLMFGLAIGASFHLQPALLPVILGLLGFELVLGMTRRALGSVALCIIGVLIACIPWAWRNYSTVGGIFFIRSNLGLELRMGNHEGAAPTMEIMDADPRKHYLHPTLLPAEASRLRELGEVEYMRRAGEDAWEWIKANPLEFLSLSAQRLANLWGVSLGKSSRAIIIQPLPFLALAGLFLALPTVSPRRRAILLGPLATYPIIYYLVPYMPRYRAPIDWILFLLAGFLVSRGSIALVQEVTVAPLGKSPSA
jgi:hypothetical protein